ncbi:unnamed protein product [Cylicostephanus goldi]|uniref:Guanylate cyclase domain-containing protein n=1 Tax=Cylicostephanus goldi TaxID=71465 RepID=A0A3P7M6V5_CYLGO|nr:unnamed protein product [Cylicostephanus goldi]
MLNELFHRFDRLVVMHKVYKVETVGDSYLTVGGIPEQLSEHAEMICHVAIGEFQKSHPNQLTNSKCYSLVSARRYKRNCGHSRRLSLIVPLLSLTVCCLPYTRLFYDAVSACGGSPVDAIFLSSRYVFQVWYGKHGQCSIPLARNHSKSALESTQDH